jgi:nitrogenase molybdenum-iron protein alpha/beta subunit
LLRHGFPVVDRLGSQHLTSLGYRGSLRLLFAAANELLAVPHGSSAHGSHRSPAPSTASREALPC